MSEVKPQIRPRLFSQREGSRYRMRRMAFLLVYLLLFAGLTTPLFGSVWQGLGWLSVPRGFWWVMATMTVSFLGLLFLYLTEDSSEETSGEGEG